VIRDAETRDAHCSTMDALAAEIAKKRKQVDGAKGGDAKRRWVRTADLQQQRRKDIEESAKRKPISKPVVVDEFQPTTPKDDDRIEERVKALSKLPSQDVIKRLRQLGQPVTLFGESDAERIRRLAVHDPRNEGEDDFRLRGGHEITEAKETKEKEEKDEEVTDDFSRIRSWIKARLKAWEAALESRSDADKRSAQGRLKTKTYKQTKEYIRPLTRLCKRKGLEPSIKGSLLEMIAHCDAGEFVKANDAYILVAIGNAAWPIGVTSVGIHTRTAREKVEQKNVAHVMNDEAQRKYLTSFKRLMKFEQDRRPDVAPSKKVL
jgi:pre-mRNA-splicing factor 18